MMKSIVIVSCLLFQGLSVCLAQTIGLSEELKANIKERVENGVCPGIVVGVVDMNGPRFYSEGVRSLTKNDPVNENSVFEIGSITKTFTGLLLADYVTKGEMKLDDPIQKYLPPGITAPTRGGKEITVAHLSNHTSSLPRLPANLKPADPTNPYADYTDDLLYEFLDQHVLTRDIGSQYEYSNYAVGLLGDILAKKRGASYEKLLTDIILKPLDLRSTAITLTPGMQQNLASGHSGGYEVPGWDLTALAGAGAIRSTAADMIKYLSANMGTTKSNLYKAMQLTHQNSRMTGQTPAVGLGWHIEVAEGQEIIWHNGGTGGYRSFIGFAKGKNIGVVVLANSNTSVDDIGMHLLNPAVPLKTIEKAISVGTSVLDRYVGQYQLAPGFVLTVSREEGQLKAQATGQPQVPIFPKSQNEFFYKVVDAQLTFNENGEGIVESVTLHQAGQRIVGKKL